MENQFRAAPTSTTRPWWKDVVCYQVWPMSFKDSNGDGHGDVQGIISKLDYLKDLGVDVIWVSPTYKSPMKDYGYDISDWQDINPDFGTFADMDQLIAEVHARGMKILLDLVVTHTSDQHPWFLESRSSQDAEKADWYMWQDPRPGKKIRNIITGRDDLVEEPNNWRACFGGSAWGYSDQRDQYYIHLFLHEEPDLNWENPVTRQAIYEAAIGFWLDRGIDGFRIDTVNRLSKDTAFLDAPIKLPGKIQPASDYYINGPRSHEFLQEMRAYMDNHPSVKSSGQDLMLVGELPRTSFREVLQYVHPKSKELSMVFDFDMVKLGGHDDPDEVPGHMVKNLSDGHESFTLPLFKEQLKKVQDLISSGAWGTVFMENHDQCRSIDRYATPDPRYYQEAAKLLCLLQTTLSGTQFVYQGQEIGMQNMPNDWSYWDFRDKGARGYMDEQYQAEGVVGWENARIGNLRVGRDNNRTPVQWTSGRNAGFSEVEEGKTWMGVNRNCKTINVQDQQNDPNSIWHFWRHQIHLRKEHREVFMHGAFKILDKDNSKTFTYLKTAACGQAALICLNFSDTEQAVYLTHEILEDRTARFLVGNLGQPEHMGMPLRAWEGRVYLLQNGVKRTTEERKKRFPVDAELEVSMEKLAGVL